MSIGNIKRREHEAVGLLDKMTADWQVEAEHALVAQNTFRPQSQRRLIGNLYGLLTHLSVCLRVISSSLILESFVLPVARCPRAMAWR